MTISFILSKSSVTLGTVLTIFFVISTFHTKMLFIIRREWSIYKDIAARMLMCTLRVNVYFVNSFIKAE